MIYLIGQAPESQRYQQGEFAHFLQWIFRRRVYQLDIETTVTRWWCDKTIITIQFGNINGTTQWVLQWSELSEGEKVAVGAILGDHTQLKLIHNAAFECIVLLFHGIRLQNVYDTMLMEQVMNCGTEFKKEEIEDDETDEAAGFFALTSLSYRYLARSMDKTEQMNFGDDILTESKVIYAAGDVVPLGPIYRMQMPQLDSLDLTYVAALENEAVLGFSEMTFNGMPLDQVKWQENIQLAAPVVAKAKAELDGWLMKEPFWRLAMDKGYYSDADRVVINWKSHQQKKIIVGKFFPFLQDKISKAVLTRLWDRWQKRGECVFSDVRAMDYVEHFLMEEWDIIEKAIVQIDRDWLINNEFLIPAGQCTLNWGSTQKVLEVLQVVNPKMASTDSDSMLKFLHPIGRSLENYRNSLKLLSTYGQAFIDKYVEPDGKVRTIFNQVVSTGRVSSRKPNMQNVPAGEHLKNRYRNAFNCEEGYSFVSSDYASMELVIIAYISGDPVWIRCLRKGEDLHSVCSELIYGPAWKKVAEEGCAYYKLVNGEPAHQKCNCKKHKSIRNGIKVTDFGLAYGLTPFTLAVRLSISKTEAQGIFDQFFTQFPKIGGALGYLSRFGIRKGYIQTLAPFFRKRWFPYWHLHQHNIEYHLQGIDTNPTLGAIGRESSNMPIQGTAADITKLSMCLMYWEIHDNGLEDLVKLCLQVHDQIDTRTRDEYTQIWAPRMSELMREAALFVIPNGLLNCETGVSPVWTK